MNTNYNISYVSCQVNCLQSVYKHTKHIGFKWRLSSRSKQILQGVRESPFSVSPRANRGFPPRRRNGGSPHKSDFKPLC